MKKLNKNKLNTQLLSLIDGMGEPSQDMGTSKFLDFLRKRGGMTPVLPEAEIKSFAPKIRRREFPFIR